MAEPTGRGKSEPDSQSSDGTAAGEPALTERPQFILHPGEIPKLESPEDLLPLVYTQLRRLAAARMADQPPGHTLQPTALVHEAYIRLKNSGRDQWVNRAQFFAAAAEAMRQILVENARRKRALRHGGGQQRVQGLEILDLPLSIDVDEGKIFEVDEALESLHLQDNAKAQVVKLRYFVGLNHAETAEVLGLSEKTVRRYWAFAKVWLYQHIQDKRTDSGG